MLRWIPRDDGEALFGSVKEAQLEGILVAKRRLAALQAAGPRSRRRTATTGALAPSLRARSGSGDRDPALARGRGSAGQLPAARTASPEGFRSPGLAPFRPGLDLPAKFPPPREQTPCSASWVRRPVVLIPAALGAAAIAAVATIPCGRSSAIRRWLVPRLLKVESPGAGSPAADRAESSTRTARSR